VAAHLVTVVMPVYNTAHFLPETIESILDQTHRNIEFFIVDDASPDDSWKVIEGYARRDNRIIAIRNEVNVGVVRTRNTGVARASGKYVALMDGDDVALPGRISAQVAFLESNPTYGACGSNIYEIDAEGRLRRTVTFPADDEEIKRSFFFLTPIRHSTLMVRKECFDKFGLYSDMPEELDLLMRVGREYRIANLQECLVKYRIHGKNYILTDHRRLVQATLRTRRKAVRVYGYPMPLLGQVSYALTWLAQFFPPGTVFRLFYLFRRLLVRG
jgi:glycosyltransferase involved in cell wall biosynthesis